MLQRVGSNDATLQSLYLMGTRSFGEREAQALCEAVIGNTSLKELNISSHAVTPAMAAAFADMLSHPACSITSLSLGNRSFGDKVAACTTLNTCASGKKSVLGVAPSHIGVECMLAAGDVSSELWYQSQH